MADSTVEIRFAAWLKANKAVWHDYFVVPALYEAAHDRRVSVQRLIENARRVDLVDSAGDPCRINNSFAPLMGRKLVHDYPELTPFVELRKSAYDHLLGEV